jgi:membrane protein
MHERRNPPPGPLSAWSSTAHVVQRVVVGAYHDGVIHAGNFAYMAMLAIFPLFILGAAIFSAIGEEFERTALIATVLFTLPPDVAEVIRPVAINVVEGRHGWLLWAGGLLGLWIVSSLVETLRDILRRAYRAEPLGVQFWKYRLASTAMILGAMLLLILSFVIQVVIGGIQELLEHLLPQIGKDLGNLHIPRLASAIGLFFSIYLLFIALTPAPYRNRRFRKWPGALFVTLWWSGSTLALPALLGSLLSYDKVYGSLAGIMITLFFFWLVGLGMVMGAELNAALAELREQNATDGDSDEPVLEG